MAWKLATLLSTAFILGNIRPVAAATPSQPQVFVIGINGAEWDIIRPLLLRGELPNLANLIHNGVSGKLRTTSAPNCPKVYSALETSQLPEQNGITGFTVGGMTASTEMLKVEPLWSILSRHGVSVGMANVPATFPVQKVDGYMVSGMLTKGASCEDGILCSPKLSEVTNGKAVYPDALKEELLTRVGDYHIDCSRMPSSNELRNLAPKTIDEWLKQVEAIREQQSKLFTYLLTNHPTTFTFFGQSCEDRVGHWLYPIEPFNVGYDPSINAYARDAFPNQYRSFDKLLGLLLEHLGPDTTVIVFSDHGIKPLRFAEDPHMHMDHGGTTPVIAKHDYEDGDEVPGIFIAMGPHIKKNVQLDGLQISVYDIAPTILHLYGIEAPKQMVGRIATELLN